MPSALLASRLPCVRRLGPRYWVSITLVAEAARVVCRRQKFELVLSLHLGDVGFIQGDVHAANIATFSGPQLLPSRVPCRPYIYFYFCLQHLIIYSGDSITFSNSNQI